MPCWNLILLLTCICSARLGWVGGLDVCSSFNSSILEKKNVPPVLITIQCLDHVSVLCKQGWHLAGFSWHKILYIWVWSIRAVYLNMLPLQFRPSENLFTYFKATLWFFKTILFISVLVYTHLILKSISVTSLKGAHPTMRLRTPCCLMYETSNHYVNKAIRGSKQLNIDLSIDIRDDGVLAMYTIL